MSFSFSQSIIVTTHTVSKSQKNWKKLMDRPITFDFPKNVSIIEKDFFFENLTFVLEILLLTKFFLKNLKIVYLSWPQTKKVLQKILGKLRHKKNCFECRNSQTRLKRIWYSSFSTF